MKLWLKFLFAAAGILVWTAAMSTAGAATYRLPQTGKPALVADAPPGWTGKYVARNEMMISAANDMAVLELSMVSDPATAAKPLPEIADRVFKDADLPRWTSAEPESIAGVPGQAFLVAVDRGQLVAFRIIIVKIDASHFARVTEIAMPKATTPEQLAGLKALVSHLSISGR